MDGGYDGIRDGSIPPFGNGGSNPPSLNLEVWQRGLMQWIANPPMYLSASVGSNPTTSVRVCNSVGRVAGF